MEMQVDTPYAMLVKRDRIRRVSKLDSLELESRDIRAAPPEIPLKTFRKRELEGKVLNQCTY